MHGKGPALAVHFLLVQTTKSIVPSPHPNVGFESQSMWRPYRLVGLSGSPTASPIMNLRRNRIGLNSYPLFSSQHFGLDEPS